jgi:hypothetical protein
MNVIGKRRGTGRIGSRETEAQDSDVPNEAGALANILKMIGGLAARATRGRPGD